MCQKLPGRSCYRHCLGKSEWFQPRKEYLRALLFFLDSLLLFFYLIGFVILGGCIYLLCVGIGYPLIRSNADTLDVWVVGPFFGLLILSCVALAGVVIIAIMGSCFSEQYKQFMAYINSEEYLLPDRVYERVEDPSANQTESELSSSIQIQ